MSTFLYEFICGLKEKIQNSMNLFKPETLNKAFNLALELEVVVGPSDKNNQIFLNHPFHQLTNLIIASAIDL